MMNGSMKDRSRLARFPEDEDQLVTYHPCIPLLSELTQEDCEALWYQHDEFARLKQTARFIARESRQHGYATSFAKCYQDTPESLLALEHWSRYAHARRGIERWCNPLFGKERKRRQLESIRTVLETQAEFRKVGGSSTTSLHNWQIADIYSRSVEPCRRYALKMGMADALAVLTERPEFDPSRVSLLHLISLSGISLKQMPKVFDAGKYGTDKASICKC